jgi:hypothetical protein
MEAVDVLVRVDRQQDVGGDDLPGQRQLDQDAVHRAILVEPVDQLQQLVLAGAGRQAMVEALHAELGGDPALALDVDLARRIVADQDGGEAGLDALRHQLGDAFADAGAQAGGEGLAVDQASFSHAPRSIARCAGRSRLTRPRSGRSWRAPYCP